MKILLDFEGVLITYTAWQPARTDADGFLAFNETSVKNLNKLIAATHATTIILTTTHRITYPLEKWKSLFAGRGIMIDTLEKINGSETLETLQPRRIEIAAWAKNQNPSSYLILDDDAGLQHLPEEIKNRWVQTDTRIGFDESKLLEALEKAKK